MQNNQIELQPGEFLPQSVKNALSVASQKNKQHAGYVKEIGRIFGLDPIENLSKARKDFLGGFFEGEGSVNVSAKKGSTSRFGILVDPEFSVTQHVNGVGQLYAYLCLFKTGRIRYKSGSNATLVYVMDNRQSLEEIAVPFWKKYVDRASTPVKRRRFAQFETLLKLMKNNGCSDLDVFCDQLLPIWDKMRMQRGQSNETFASLDAAQQFARDHVRTRGANARSE